MAIAFTVLWILSQILVFHLTSTRQLFKTLTLLFIFSFPAYGAVYLWTSPTLGFLPDALTQTPAALGLLNGLGLYLLLYVTYVACFYYVDRPLTLRILIAFLKAPEGKLTLSEVKTVYGLRYMILRRLEAMQDGGLVVEKNGKYFLTLKGKCLGKLFHLGRSLLKIDRRKNIVIDKSLSGMLT